MNIKEMNCTSGYVTVTMRYDELRTLTNILCKARTRMSFKERDLRVNAELFTIVTVLDNGCIPEFEREHIYTLYESAKLLEQEKKSKVEQPEVAEYEIFCGADEKSTYTVPVEREECECVSSPIIEEE